ncbi:MAG: hypothetical protein GY810_14440 [Aureispira sp.]|nr:hypothetical protein [Aureispira sp.]
MSINNFRLLEHQTDFFSDGDEGLKCVFNLEVCDTNLKSLEASYSITWQLKTASGVVAYDSRNASKIFYEKESVSLKPDPIKDCSQPKEVEIFIPYKDLILPTVGAQEFRLVLSAEKSGVSIPNFWSTSVQFEYSKKYQKTLIEPIFKVSDLKTKHQLNRSKKVYGIAVTGDMAMLDDSKLNTISESYYKLEWIILDASGYVLFNAKKAKSFFSHTSDDYVFFDHLKKDGKIEIKTFIDYSEFDLSGNQTFVFQLFSENGKEEKAKIHEQNIEVKLPEFKRFEDQEFDISNVDITPSSQHGIQGLSISFDCKLKYIDIRQDKDAGKPYFFYAKIKKDDKVVYEPSGRINFANEHYFLLSATQKDKGKVFKLRQFIPYFLIESSPGQQTWALTIEATDDNGQVKFGELLSKKIDCNKPPMQVATIVVDGIAVVEKNYDVKGPTTHLKHKSDLQWRIKAGKIDLYKSKVIYNSYIWDSQEKGTIRFSKGDELYLNVLDHDNFLNGHDLIGKLLIPYASKGASFEGSCSDKQDIKSLHYSFEVQQK